MADLIRVIVVLAMCVSVCIPARANPSGPPAGVGGMTNADVFVTFQWYGPFTRSMPEVGFAGNGHKEALKAWGAKGPRRWITVLSAGECQTLTQYVEGGKIGVDPVMSAPSAAVQQYAIIWRLMDGNSEYFPVGWTEKSTVKVLKGLQQCLGDEARRTMDHVLGNCGPRGSSLGQVRRGGTSPQAILLKK